MRKRIQYFLVFLLFMTVGVLCRQQFAVGVAAGSDNGAFFSQPRPFQHDATGRFFARTLFAPELSGGVTSENPDQKTPVRCIALPGCRPCAAYAISTPIAKKALGLPPRSVDYYIFSLGKILI